MIRAHVPHVRRGPAPQRTSSNTESQQQLSSLRIDDDEDDGERRDWASLPLDLLKICLGAPQLADDRRSKHAALTSCKALGRAVVRASPGGLRFGLDRRAKFAPSARIWRELWGAERPQQDQLVGLGLSSFTQGSPGRCWSELLGAGERLPFVTHLELKGLSLDVLLPQGASVLLPHLQQLFLRKCALTPAARATALDAGCSTLHTLQVEGLTTAAPPPTNSLQQLATAQLRQLAKLPSLSIIVIDDDSCPTLFLVALGSQVTSLFLHESNRQCEPGTQAPTPGWRATLQHIARCTRLRDLTIPCFTAEELGQVAPALQHLRSLGLSGLSSTAADGDAVVDVLLGLPHLTRLAWDTVGSHTMRRWYNDRPCRWEHLSFAAVTPQQLARLPLHSLKQPVEWRLLQVQPGTSLRDARAAVANITQRCPAGFCWCEDGMLPHLTLNNRIPDALQIMRVLRPLLVPVTGLGVFGDVWDVELVKALGEVLPCTCTRLMLSGGSMPGKVLEQVARSLPWLRCLTCFQQQVAPEDVVAYVRLARRLDRAGGAVLEEVVVTHPVYPEGVGEAEHRQAWQRAALQVHKMGWPVLRLRLE